MTTIPSQGNNARSRRWLVLIVLCGSALLLAAGFFVGGQVGLMSAALSLLACGAPAVFCFAVSKMLKPLQMLVASTMLRMAFALALAVGAKVLRPELGLREFYVWLLAAYMLFLTIDTFELLSSNQREVSNV